MHGTAEGVKGSLCRQHGRTEGPGMKASGEEGNYKWTEVRGTQFPRLEWTGKHQELQKSLRDHAKEEELLSVEGVPAKQFLANARVKIVSTPDFLGG